MCYQELVLNLKAQFRAWPVENKWLLLNGQGRGGESKGTLQRAIAVEITPRAGSRAHSSSQLSLGAGSCSAVLPWLEGEPCDRSFLSHAHCRYCDPWAGARASSCFRSIWDWLLVKPVYSSLLLRASAWLALRHGWWGLTLSPLQLQICPSTLAGMAESVDCLGPSWELHVTKAFLSLIRYSAVPFLQTFWASRKQRHTFFTAMFSC